MNLFVYRLKRCFAHEFSYSLVAYFVAIFQLYSEMVQILKYMITNDLIPTNYN